MHPPFTAREKLALRLNELKRDLLITLEILILSNGHSELKMIFADARLLSSEIKWMDSELVTKQIQQDTPKGKI